MAKKLNKTVAIIAIILVILVVGSGAGFLVLRQMRHNPERALEKAHQALEAGDYKEAEKQLGRSYVFGKTDEYKIERLFELADFHLIDNDMHEPDWSKAMGFWNKIVSIDPGNIKARRNLLDFFYQAADAGQGVYWKRVNEQTTELIDTLEKQQQQPDAFLLTAHAKSLLAISSRGETTDRRTPLKECVQMLEKLLEQSPGDAELYQLMAQAAVLQGELDAQAGVINAEKNAKEAVNHWYQTAIEQADDKTDAVANLMMYKLQNSVDPNSIEQCRAELEEWRGKIQPNAKFWLVTSLAYETLGGQSPQAEINRAIDAISQARQLEPTDFEYTFRMARLLYRKGQVFHDPASIQDALDLAEGALSLDEVKDTPGPLQGRNTNYRLTLNMFLANIYLEKAIEAQQDEDTEQATLYRDKAAERVDVITAILGTTDSPLAVKYEGLLAMAEGQVDRAARLLYKSYEQSKALDKPEDVQRGQSNVDAYVCTVLADIAAKQNQLGMQAEFLRMAISSRDRIAIQKPEIYIDYASVLGRLGAWDAVASLVKQYHSRYPATQESRSLAIRAAIVAGDTEQVQAGLSELDPKDPQTLELKITDKNTQLSRLEQTLNAPDAGEPTAEQNKQRQQLRDERLKLLGEMVDTFPDKVSAGLLVNICSDAVRQGHTNQILPLLDSYLKANPDAANVRMFRLQCNEPNPLDISAERLKVLNEQAIQAVQDPTQKAVLMASFYQGQKEYDKAIDILQDAQKTQDDPVLPLTEFDILLAAGRLDQAESLIQTLRAINADKCEGNLLAARVEMEKGNDQSALQRLDQCLELRPMFSYGYVLKSRVYRQLKQIPEAVENAKIAVQMDPQNAGYTRHLATLLFERNTELGSKVTPQQQRETENALYAAIRLNPTDWQLQSIYAESIWTQSPDKALAIRQQLLERNPNASNALMLGNMALRMAGDQWDAAKRSGLIQAAGQAFQKAYELEPDNELAKQAYADYQQRYGEGEEALKLIKDDENLLWKFYLRNGQFENAKPLIEELIAKNPDDVLLLQGLVMAMEGTGDRDGLKPVLEQIYDKDDSKEMQLWVMQKFMDNGLAAEAQQRLDGFKERFPDVQTALLFEAWVDMQNGYLEQAMETTNRYLETNTDNPGAWQLRGRLYRLLDNPRKAIDDLQRSKDLQDTPKVRLELATLYDEINQDTAAIGELVSALDDPQTPLQVRLTLEQLYQKNNRTDDLLKFYQSTIEKYPQSAYWYYRAGAYFLSTKAYRRAEPLLEQAWKLTQTTGQINTSVLNSYLEVLLQSEQYDKAFTIASELVDGPAAPIVYAFIGQIQSHKGRSEEAVNAFYSALDKAGADTSLQALISGKMVQATGQESVQQWITQTLSKDAQSVPAHLLAAQLAQDNGAYNKAIEHVDQVIEVVGAESPNWVRYALQKVNLLIMAYTKTADQAYMQQAVSLLEQVLKLQPYNTSVLNNLAYLLADNDQRLEDALTYSRDAYQRDPGNAVFLDTYAYVQCKNGKAEDAERNLMRAIRMYEASDNPVPWDLYKHLAMAYEAQGKNEQAVKMYQEALNASTEIPDKEKQSLQTSIDKLSQQ